MNTTLKQLAAAAVLTVASATAAEPAIADPVAKSDRTEDKTVHLSPFAVDSSAAGIGRYALLESISAGRVRMDIMDSSQSISVLTGEVIEDVAAGRVVDATKYVAGVSEGPLPTSWEFTNIRGFLTPGRTVDGITYGAYPANGFQNVDPVLFERIEAVKGPNSVLAPQGPSPGGTVNLVTKKPQFRDFGRVSVQWGEFDANGAAVDVNRVLGDKLAFRFVGSGRYFDHWWDNAWVHNTTLMPAFTYRFSAKAQLTFQYTYTDWSAQNYFGLPIDPTSTSTNTAQTLAGIPRNLNFVNDDVARTTRQHEFKVLGAAELGWGIQMRLVAAYNTAASSLDQINTGPSTGGTGGSYDPLTGLWNYGLQYQQTPPYASSPIAMQPTRIYTRSGVALVNAPEQYNVQNDYAYIHEGGTSKSTTLAGFAYTEIRDDDSKAYALALAVPTFDIDHPTFSPWARAKLTNDNHNLSIFKQLYLSENLALFQNHLILNAAESWQKYDNRVDNLIKHRSASIPQHTALPSYGVVIKPWRDSISVYYAYTEQSSANTPDVDNKVPPLSTSTQNEFGARFKIWNDRFYFTVSHYEIHQTNFATPNPRNLTTPPPDPQLPSFYIDRNAEGWEYELRANPTRSLSLIASYTHFRNRDPNGVAFRGVAEAAGNLLASYAFGPENIAALDGFHVAVGVDYLGNRPGDNSLLPSPLTPASTPDHPIPYQPSFYLGARTLVNLTLAYDSKHHWGAQLNVDNLFNEEYVQVGIMRTMAFAGSPTNVRFTVRYNF